MSMRSSGDTDGAIAEINVTPLVDVMLVLLIIFIVTAPMITPQAMKISLPQTDPVVQRDQAKNEVLVISKDGSMIYKGAHISEAELKAFMVVDGKTPHYQLQVQADEAVPYGRVAQVMAWAQAAGLQKLTFITIQRRQYQ
ncbi:biopolymer transporter ExbD [Limnohabitans sp. Rim47]|uniref:ExbD/TolR family protein n=1 Tax=Limnohabitans sp. Rim47 TaxID=1100721 RepID=UPI0002E6A837|nr:biopolymer transporter ExbD [Limnohabitans sp. Rim47]